jgi:protein tyrosine/serine phosphatase
VADSYQAPILLAGERPKTARTPLQRLARFAGLCLLCTVLLGGGYLGALQLTGNFNTVIKGELYRSGQISPQQLKDYVAEYGIKTIVNLRGDNHGDDWYETEVAQSRDLGIEHIDFGLWARRELPPERAAQLMAILRAAPKPILIHCKAGADRSGLVSALYLAIIKQQGRQVANAQLSIRYGHISLPFIPEYAMDRSLANLERDLAVSIAE